MTKYRITNLKLTEIDLGLPSQSSHHEIVLVSPKNCDLHESAYVASEVRPLFVDAPV